MYTWLLRTAGARKHIDEFSIRFMLLRKHHMRRNIALLKTPGAGCSWAIRDLTEEGVMRRTKVGRKCRAKVSLNELGFNVDYKDS